MKVVINRCWGGFSLSKVAVERMAELGDKGAKKELRELKKETKIEGKEPFYANSLYRDVSRESELMIKVIEELGDNAYGQHAKLGIVEIPDGVDYYIDEYYGMEEIHETHKSWR